MQGSTRKPSSSKPKSWPAMPGKPYYENESVRLYRGNCLDLLGQIPRGSVDVVATSPPYNQLGKNVPRVASGMHKGGKWVEKINSIGYFDDRPEPVYQAWLHLVVAMAIEASKGLVWINHKVRYRDRVGLHPLRYLPFPLFAEVIWDRGTGMCFNASRYVPSHEAWYAFGRPHWWNRELDAKFTVWKLRSESHRDDHPCPFPEELVRRPIVSSCPPGGIVVDPFSGSGTTGVVATREGRRCILMEEREDFCESTAKRLEAESEKLLQAA